MAERQVVLDDTLGELKAVLPPLPDLRAYGASGLLPAPKLWVGAATTNGSGAWTVDTSSAGFTAVHVPLAVGWSGATAQNSQLFVSIQDWTLTQVRGFANTSASSSVLGLGTVNQWAGNRSVLVWVLGA
ncbi:MAG: hypothetical protein QM621_08655 [Aeromicrobium sp.]|uniref:hypothetical protein n=1 Tax=Aeromicrobium sp. TaxID=1871063 RepID=UPI0039E60876